MSHDKRETQEAVAVELVQATGITIAQARELVRFLGADWSSLVREARLIRKAGLSNI